MKIKIQYITTAALTAFIPLLLSSCLKDKAVPLFPNQPATVPANYTYAATADSLQAATYKTYISANGNYFVNNNAGNTTYNYWPQAHVLDAFTDAFIRTKDAIYQQRMKSLLNGTRITNGGSYPNEFYDDMEWLALASLRAFEATNDNDYLNAANILWTDIKTGVNGNQGGGIAWRKSQLDYKNTPANAPAIIFACRLYRLRNDAANLTLARTLYAWMKSKLVDASTGIIYDGVNSQGNGQLDKNKYTYNQGVYMGAALELYNVTKESAYLDDAVKNANAVINDVDLAPGGILKSEGQGDGGLFKGILIRYLTLLAQNADVSGTNVNNYLNFLKNNFQTLYGKGISRPALLVSPDWKTQPSGTIDLTTQTSGLTAIEAAAALKAAGKI